MTAERGVSRSRFMPADRARSRVGGFGVVSGACIVRVFTGGVPGAGYRRALLTAVKRVLAGLERLPAGSVATMVSR